MDAERRTTGSGTPAGTVLHRQRLVNDLLEPDVFAFAIRDVGREDQPLGLFVAQRHALEHGWSLEDAREHCRWLLRFAGTPA